VKFPQALFKISCSQTFSICSDNICCQRKLAQIHTHYGSVPTWIHVPVVHQQ